MTRKILVGMLLLGALIIFVVGTFYIENWQLAFSRGYVLRANFPTAQTLDTGDLVRLAGVQVGRVASLKINTEMATSRPVEATLWIKRGVIVRAGDKAVVNMSTLFGGNYIEITRGTDPNARILADGDMIQNTATASSITEVIEKSTATLEEVRKSFESVNRLAADLEAGKGTLGKLFQEDDLYVRLDSMIADATTAMSGFKAAGDRLERGEGTLGRLLMDETMADQVSSIAADASEVAANLKSVSADLEAGTGTMGKLFKDEALYDDFKSAVASINDTAKSFREGEGILPRLLDDKQMADDLRAALADTRTVLGNLADGKGSAGKLLTDDEVYTKLVASLDNLKEVTGNIAEGKGTAGKLIQSDEMYNELQTLVQDVQGIVDNYREQSPVISLAGALFGAF